jgi:hypothetical protein
LYQRGYEALARENYLEAVEYLFAFIEEAPAELPPDIAAELKGAVILAEERIRSAMLPQEDEEQVPVQGKARSIGVMVSVTTNPQDSASPLRSYDTLHRTASLDQLGKDQLLSQGETSQVDETTRTNAELLESEQELHDLFGRCRRILQEYHVQQTDIDSIAGRR